MNVDRYTKAVLTVIAGCLLWICVMGAAPGLQAQHRESEPDAVAVDLKNLRTIAQPVILVGTGTIDRQGNVQVAFNQQGRTDSTLAVRLPYSPTSPMAVEISAVKKAGPWESLRADVDDVPLRANPGPRR